MAVTASNPKALRMSVSFPWKPPFETARLSWGAAAGCVSKRFPQPFETSLREAPQGEVRSLR